VVDDGKGMSETDARMAFERHATSKSKEQKIFLKLLPKVSVAKLWLLLLPFQVELRTKQKDASIGTNIYIEGGFSSFRILFRRRKDLIF
jgi:DNA mismatch repair protein MutL